MQANAVSRAMCRLALEAGEETLNRFEENRAVAADVKDDGSPVTEADRAANRIIVDGLRALYPDIPIVTEEEAASHRQHLGPRFFLVDPLDGTKEFVAGSGEFTINIALIEQGAPRLGVVFAPARERLFWTPDPDFAVEERRDALGDVHMEHLWVATADNTALRAVASKSHRDAETEALLSRYAVAETRSAGSSLKFCLIASGEADLYPRMGPTMAWDVAAAHAVLRAAGGRVRRVASDGAVGAPLSYGPRRDADPLEVWRNPSFLAYAPSVSLR